MSPSPVDAESSSAAARSDPADKCVCKVFIVLGVLLLRPRRAKHRRGVRVLSIKVPDINRTLAKGYEKTILLPLHSCEAQKGITQTAKLNPHLHFSFSLNAFPCVPAHRRTALQICVIRFHLRTNCLFPFFRFTYLFPFQLFPNHGSIHIPVFPVFLNFHFSFPLSPFANLHPPYAFIKNKRQQFQRQKIH